MGDTTHLPQRHLEMTNRRFSKLNLLENESYEKLNEEAEICLMPWGGSKGPSLEVYNLLVEECIDLGWYYTMYINPLPKKLVEELKGKK
jgi:pyruvate/2-oxoacid:ferredoxin oxidoreductase alpha subunit